MDDIKGFVPIFIGLFAVLAVIAAVAALFDHPPILIGIIAIIAAIVFLSMWRRRRRNRV